MSSTPESLGVNKPNFNSITTAAVAGPKQRPQLKSCSSAPLNNAASYKELVAQFTAKAPQPYGIIPPRRRKPTGRTRASSTSSLSLSPSTSKKATLSSPPSPTDLPGNVVELLPTTHSAPKPIDRPECFNTNSSIIQPLFHSLQSLLPESTSSSTRLGFWANLKAHYLAATGASNGRRYANGSAAGVDAFLPPVALRVSNCTPVAAVDATAPLSASLTFTDALLSLPNLAAPSAHACHGSVNYPVSVAAMDKFKAIRSDTIPLKTFTYHETPVVERPRPTPLPHSLRSSSSLSAAKDDASSTTQFATGTLTPPLNTKNNKSASDSPHDASLLCPLPRHLAARETRSNADYLRMMAAELRMIRSRKLISPLKPRGYLPRRKDPFRKVKSSLCISLEMPKDEDDHPLNDIMGSSWSSVSSADSFLSTASSGYQTASEGF
ncbi:hypothetical protein BGZ72_007179 [Mortierella alpina]|nr:hypothetical protein BGZ72_007179 [Mortierella alpina]